MSVQEDSLFPFVLPWDDGSPGVTDLSGLNDKPAGKLGFIKAGKDGHLYAGDIRIRFMGINFTYTSCFPKKEAAVKIAARLAKFGINIVRFHLMDAYWGKENIFDRTTGGTRKLNPDTVDRLDYFIAELKKNGIYADINLLTGRIFTPADGLPASIKSLEWKDHQTPAMFNPRMIELQKEYARELLDRINPYTNTRYTEEPAVAFVEICNEHGLIHAWMDGSCDRMPDEFKSELTSLWNDYLKKEYPDDKALATAWLRSEPSGSELLKNNGFDNGFAGWTLEQHSGAKAEAGIVPDVNGNFINIKVLNTSKVDWHIQFNQNGLSLAQDVLYTLQFRARADKKTEISVVIEQAHEPWQQMGFSRNLSLAPEWREFSFTLSLKSGDSNARLTFRNMGDEKALYSIGGLSLKQGGSMGMFPGESVEKGSVRLFSSSDQSERTFTAGQDFIKFLWELEKKYWNGIRDYVRQDLKVKAPVMGTVVGNSTPNLMDDMDVVDSHAYWQHPQFEVSWGSPWRYRNASMVGEKDGGNIGQLSVKRVSGKPFCVSEYNHPYPNTYGCEAMPFLAAYAAFQDWDAIFAYTYADGTNDWDSQKIRGYFDWDRDPVKMAGLIPAAMFFRRQDISPAKETVAALMTEEKEWGVLSSAHQWRLVDGEFVGMRRETSLLHRLELATSIETFPEKVLGIDKVKIPDNGVYVSDTGQIIWDTQNRVLTVNTPLSKMVLGHAAGKKFDLDGIMITPVSSLQGWFMITMNVKQGKGMKEAGSVILVTAAGPALNTGTNYRNYPDNSPAGFPPPDNGIQTLGKNDWGRGPVLTEGMRCKIGLPLEAVSVYALDNTGNRTEEVPGTTDSGYKVFELSGRYRTLWYEAVLE
ncbi:MAG: carbohydrate binding domain-containing protein [Spirochaetales bacterium]|nr:carbohydrate binding domain-containing protein [Spirochaetales bacterium]